MKKKLVYGAVAAALAAGPIGAAQAASAFGKVQFELASEQVDGDGGGDGHVVLSNGVGNDRLPDDAITIEDNQRGRVGFKGSSDMGNGMTMHGILSADWSTTGGVGSTRQANVGIKGGFGDFSIGRVKSPYKYTGGVRYDPFVTTNLEARRYGGMTQGAFGHNSFLTNHLSYKSPKIGGGFQVWGTYSPSEVDDRGPENTKGDFSLSAKYGAGPFEAFLATAHDDGVTVDPATGDEADSGEYDAWKVGGKFSVGQHTVVAQYEDTEQENPGMSSTDGSVFFGGYHYQLGKTKLVAQFGMGDVEFPGGGPDQEHTYYTLGAYHKFTKQARMFGGYSATDVEDGAGVAGDDWDRSVFTVGMRLDF